MARAIVLGVLEFPIRENDGTGVVDSGGLDWRDSENHWDGDSWEITSAGAPMYLAASSR